MKHRHKRRVAISLFAVLLIGATPYQPPPPSLAEPPTLSLPNHSYLPAVSRSTRTGNLTR